MNIMIIGAVFVVFVAMGVIYVAISSTGKVEEQPKPKTVISQEKKEVVLEKDSSIPDLDGKKEMTEQVNRIKMPNLRYTPRALMRVCEIELMDTGRFFGADISAKSYDQGMDAIEATIITRDKNRENVQYKKKVFTFKAITGDEIWLSETTKLDSYGTLVLGEIRNIDVVVTKVIWEDGSETEYDTEESIKSFNKGKIRTLRNVFGSDVFSDYDDRGKDMGYGCICGFYNKKSVDSCELCGRNRKEMAEKIPKGGIIELLNNCQTIEEAKVVVEENIVRMPQQIGEKLIVRIETDLKSKELYNKQDDKYKISKYIEIAMEVLMNK